MLAYVVEYICCSAMNIIFGRRMEEYRSGHNGPHSKCGSPKGLVGSNPTSSANNGMWLSLVEHYVRDVGAAGSNPVIPTTDKTAGRYCPRFFCAPRLCGAKKNRRLGSDAPGRLFLFIDREKFSNQSSKPLGCLDCHLHESSHISSMPRSATQPSSFFAFVASA